MSKKNHIEKIFKSFFSFLLVSIVVVLAFSILLFKKIGGNNPARNNYAGGNGAPLPSSERPPVELPKVLYNLSGKITKIEKNAVTFDATISSKDSKGEIVSSIESRKANIGSAVDIKKLVFVKNSPVESAIKFNDLKVGDYVEIISDRDISNAAEFSAVLVRVLP